MDFNFYMVLKFLFLFNMKLRLIVTSKKMAKNWHVLKLRIQVIVTKKSSFKLLKKKREKKKYNNT